MNTRLFSKITMVTGFLLLSVSVLGTSTLAKEKFRTLHRQLLITSVFVDFGNEAIIIEGRNFGRWRKPVVTLDGERLEVTSFEDEMIVVPLPAGLLDGDYLLTVSIGFGLLQYDAWNLTVAPDKERFPSLKCEPDEVAKWSGSSWVCAVDEGITEEQDPTVPENVKDGVSWAEIANIPSDIADGDQVGIKAETDPTITDPRIKDGVSWDEIANIPSDIANGDQVGIIAETDPTIKDARIKDGVSWDEIANIPSDIADGDQVGITGESELNFIPKWNGSELVKGSIYDDGDVGIHVEKSRYPVIRGVRTTTLSSGLVSGLAFTAKSSGDMEDGFGAALNFEIQDSEMESPNWVTAIGSMRDGADDSGKFFVKVRGGGNNSHPQFVVDKAGNVGIGKTNPNEALDVTGNIQASGDLQVNGYVQLALTDGPPPSADCNADSYGRMKFDPGDDGGLYICGASGWWVYK